MALSVRLLQLADGAVPEIEEIDAANRRRLAAERPLGSRVPAAGGDDPAQAERGARGFGQEAVDVALRYQVIFRVALALDGDKGAAAQFGD